MASSALPSSSDAITSIVFGLTAIIISVVTVWQGHRAWKIWREYHVHGQNDIEMNRPSTQSAPRSLETSDPEAVVGPPAPLADHTGAIAGPESMPVSIQGANLQSTVPTTVDNETSSSPTGVQEAQIEDDGLSGVHAEDAQPAMTDTETEMEHVEPRPPANSDHDLAGVH